MLTKSEHICSGSENVMFILLNMMF